MIKIQLSEQQRREIETVYIKSLKKKLITRLEAMKDNKLFSADHLYKWLCDDSEKYRNLEIYLTLDKVGMEKLIEKCNQWYDADEKVKWEVIFNYTSVSRRKVFTDILNMLNVRICPYCNRQYIITLASGKVKAQFDHYFSQSQYPYLALNLWNLIPCCGTCNTAKASRDMLEVPILYPYEEEFGYDAMFKIVPKENDDLIQLWRGETDRFEVGIEAVEGELDERVKNQNELLNICELYNNHKDCIKDIIKKHYVYSDQYIDELRDRFPELFNSQGDVRDLIYGNYNSKEEWGNRILSKLTYDILRDLDDG